MCVYVYAKLPHLVQLFVTLWTVAAWLLCPWVSPGKGTGVDFHTFLQEIFPIQGLNPYLYASCIGRWILYC